ncbi:hypothetical protein LRP50_19935 [Enterovibrio sp. ZSDZ42]|uniref:Uncharacterized protein n=1 Tax=Enterovibrio gelatinilyticus TaxID=2899819 RepID=A0ABT5R5E5_9GAMM|nr:hypothetical protein [Enterovibrio sp. ZSDZ42]MDD1795405.1 hypothetical protein [Enterovibrio sp. ZSDZ42]
MKYILLLILITFTTHVSAALKEYKLPTAEDGEIVFIVDDETKLPVSASDDMARVIEGALTFLPKNPGESLRWTWQYRIQFLTDQKVKSVVIEDERDEKIKLLIEDDKPLIVNNEWTGVEKSMHLSKSSFEMMKSEETWLLLRRVRITYEDGQESKLHQMIVVTQPMRIDILNETIAALKARE